MAEFAEQEIIIPTGPFSGRAYSLERNPFAAAWFREIDSGRWKRNVATGPQQSGKTLQCSVIPLMYHLFEMRETVIFGLPSLDMVNDKWKLDILPAIEASRYREFLPSMGASSRGGSVESSVQFRHGPTLRFMTGGSGDKGRAGFTSRVLMITETDGMDVVGRTSREADKITQLEGRTSAYHNARIYMECTVSIEKGRTWQEIQHGTATRIAIRCPKCAKRVTPEREHLIGWQEAVDVLSAAEGARVVCPGCGVLWEEADRISANHDWAIVHKGQELTEAGEVVGALPRTDTLGFRWTAMNNLLVPMSEVAKREWRARHADDQENAEKALRQFVWALPHMPDSEDVANLDADGIQRRMNGTARGHVPDGCDMIAVGVDIGKRLCHWTAIAFDLDGTPSVIDYGRIEVASDSMLEERAIRLALRDFRDLGAKGWPQGDRTIIPEVIMVDSGYQGGQSKEKAVYDVCREAGAVPMMPVKGFGEAPYGGRGYSEPRARSKTVVEVGDAYHISRQAVDRIRLVECNADAWKSRLHEALTVAVGKPGALTLHQAGAHEHLAFAKHLLAERQYQEWVAGRGLVTKWKAVSRNNHWLDSSSLALLGGTYAISHRRQAESDEQGKGWWKNRGRRRAQVVETE